MMRKWRWVSQEQVPRRTNLIGRNPACKERTIAQDDTETRVRWALIALIERQTPAPPARSHLEEELQAAKASLDGIKMITIWWRSWPTSCTSTLTTSLNKSSPEPRREKYSISLIFRRISCKSNPTDNWWRSSSHIVRVWLVFKNVHFSLRIHQVASSSRWQTWTLRKMATRRSQAMTHLLQKSCILRMTRLWYFHPPLVLQEKCMRKEDSVSKTTLGN